jgi:hypothetical protein
MRYLVFFLLVSLLQAREPDYYIWHWHLNHELDQKSRQLLKSIPIKGLFYRTANFALINNKPVVETLKKTSSTLLSFSSMNEFKEIHLCYTFGNSSISPFVKAFLNKSADNVQWTAEAIIEDYLLWKQANSHVKGIQIDLEGGGIDFGIYKDLLGAIKTRLPKALISITPMSSWVKRKEFDEVAALVDFIVPMLYDYRRARKANGTLKVTDPQWSLKTALEWTRFKKPVIAGIPTYSYCILYDETGKMTVPWALYNPNSVSENKRLTLKNFYYNQSVEGTLQRDRVISYESSDRFMFQSKGYNAGSQFRYNFISASAAGQYIDQYRQAEHPLIPGVAFFRFGTPYEKLVLTASELKQAVQEHYSLKAELELKLIPSSKGSFRLRITNKGCPSYFGTPGLKIKLEHCRLKGVITDFDSALNTEDNAELTEIYLESSEMIISPPIHCSNSVKASVAFHAEDGKEYSHTITLKNDTVLFPSR